MTLKICKDGECLNAGIAQRVDNFPPNQNYEDKLHIYCHDCCARRTDEYRHDRVLQEENHTMATYLARHEAKRQYEMEQAVSLRQHERLYDPWVPLPPPALPFWKKAEYSWHWEVK